MLTHDNYLTSAEAAEALGVKRESLYAYVSRGWLQSVAVPGRRERLYLRHDVERLRDRRPGRSDDLESSSITAITNAGPSYRGHAAVDLAQSGATFEGVAELLWTGEPPENLAWRIGELPFAPGHLASLVPEVAHPLEALALVLPAVAVVDPARFARNRQAELELARRMLRFLAAAPALGAGVATFRDALSTFELSSSLLVAFGRSPDPEPMEAVRTALVLCADHGIDNATRVARMAAGDGADLYACVSAALAVFAAPANGRGAERVQAMLREIGTLDRVASAVRDRLGRGDSVPGFGHPSYPDGDPRAGLLFEVAARVAPPHLLNSMISLRDTMSLVGQRPNLDYGLAALGDALQLPYGAATVLKAIGRAAGWIAHVLERREH